MASPATSSTGPVKLDIKIDADRVSAEFKEARKLLRGKVKEGLQEAAENVALPAVKVGIPVKTGKLKSTLKAKATQRYGYIQAGRASVPYAGLLEFGGTVRETIRPKSKKALVINGQPRASVKKPRTYKARHYLQDPIFRKQPQIRDAIQTNVMESFAGLDVSGAGSSSSISKPGLGGLA